MRFKKGSFTYTETERGYDIEVDGLRLYADVPIGVPFPARRGESFWNTVLLRQVTYWLAWELGNELDNQP